MHGNHPTKERKRERERLDRTQTGGSALKSHRQTSSPASTYVWPTCTSASKHCFQQCSSAPLSTFGRNSSQYLPLLASNLRVCCAVRACVCLRALLLLLAMCALYSYDIFLSRFVGLAASGEQGLGKLAASHMLDMQPALPPRMLVLEFGPQWVSWCGGPSALAPTDGFLQNRPVNP